jgi:hypothetical protein
MGVGGRQRMGKVNQNTVNRYCLLISLKQHLTINIRLTQLKNRFIILLSCICFVNCSFGQTDSTTFKNNNIQFDFGFVHSRLIDEGYTASDLLIRGTNPKFRLGYGRGTEKYIFNFLFEASSGKVTSKSGNLPSEFTNVKSTLEYLRNVKQYTLFGMESRFFAGLNVNSNNYDLENGPVFDNSDIFSVHGIYMGLVNQIKLKKSQRLQIAYLLPAAVSVNRILESDNNLTKEDDQHPVQMLFSNKSTSYFKIDDFIQLKIGYEKNVSRTASITATYSFFYMNNTFEAPIRMYTNELLAGVKFNF